MDSVDTAYAVDLQSWLYARMSSAEQVLLRSPELTLAGVQALAPALQDLVERDMHLEVVLAVDGGRVDPAAMRALLDLVEDAGNASVRMTADKHVAEQPAAYYVQHLTGSAAWVGTAPITAEGMARGRQQAVVLSSGADGDAVLDAIRAGLSRQHEAGQPAAPETLVESVTSDGHAEGPLSELFGDLLQRTVETLDAVAGGHGPAVPTGFTEFDALTGGLYPGTVTVVAGRSGVGTSTAALDIVRRNAFTEKRSVALVQLDQARGDVMQRLLSAEARIRCSDMRQGLMSDDDWTRLARRMPEISAGPLLLQTGPVTWDLLRREIRRWRAEHGIAVLVIDPVTVLAGEAPAALTEVMHELRAVALELEIAVVLTCRTGGPTVLQPVNAPAWRVALPDAVAHLADLVVHLHRPDHEKRDDPRMGEVDLIVAKNRTGPTGTVTLAHQLHYSRFVNLSD